MTEGCKATLEQVHQQGWMGKAVMLKDFEKSGVLATDLVTYRPA